MKKIKSIAIVSLALLVLGFNSCSPEFLDRKPTTAVSSELALTSIDNVRAATVGLMVYFATAAYTGRNLPVIGDLIADNLTTKSGNSGHLLDIEMWNISSSLSEIGVFWNGSYQIVSASSKVIKACDDLRASATKDGDRKTLDKCKAAALTIKTFAEYIITQYYCLPYSAAGQSRGSVQIGSTPAEMNGIILVTRPILADEANNPNSPLEIASLEDTYIHMHNQLKQAINLFDSCDSKDFGGNAFFPSTCMAYTIQARLFLEQGKYNEAIAAADNALNNLVNGAKKDIVNDGQAFVEQYRSFSAPTSEDILTISFTTSDNLSANSINNMFGSYGCKVSKGVTDLIQGTDIRRPIYLTKGVEAPDLEIYSACGKFPNKNYINNVPVLRVPELYLIKAEARAKLTNSIDDQEYADAMMATLGRRDTAIHSYDDMKANYFNDDTKTALDYVLDERRREFAGEGHRWFDLRRNQKVLTRTTGKEENDLRIAFSNYPIGIFAFPIPESETNTGAWHNGILGKGTRGQNEAWEASSSGDSWVSKFGLPVNGGNYL